jgi:hypothetical protein
MIEDAMKTLINGKSVERRARRGSGLVMPNHASNIISAAKTLDARNATLQAACDRKDADLRELREALAKERGRFSWPEFSFGVVIGGFAALIAVAALHHG